MYTIYIYGFSTSLCNFISLASWAGTKSKIIDAFKDASVIMRNSVVILLDHYHHHLEQLVDKLEELVALLPVNGDSKPLKLAEFFKSNREKPKYSKYENILLFCR